MERKGKRSQAEKMRRQKEYADTVREQSKRRSKTALPAPTEPEDTGGVEAAQSSGKEGEREPSWSPPGRPDRLHSPETTGHLGDRRACVCASLPQPQPDEVPLPPCCLQGLESSPRGGSASVAHTVQVPDEEPSASAACDGYLGWMRKKQQSVIQSAMMAEKTRRKRENTRAKKKKKKKKKTPITPPREPEEADAPRMKAAQSSGKEGEQDPSCSPPGRPDQLHSPETGHLGSTVPGWEPPGGEEGGPSASAASGGCSRAEEEKQQQSNARVSQQGPEQKKNKKRTPFTPTKRPKDKDSPRMKTLEFVKTLGKPVDGLDISQLSRLDFLIKQHREEKRAVALLLK